MGEVKKSRVGQWTTRITHSFRAWQLTTAVVVVT